MYCKLGVIKCPISRHCKINMILELNKVLAIDAMEGTKMNILAESEAGNDKGCARKVLEKE